MIENSSIQSVNGTYIYDIGRIRPDESLTARAYVVLKGEQRNNTKLQIGEVVPDGVVKASLGDPKESGTMMLYPLELEFIPSAESVERTGKNKDDYGTVWIESDNPKVSKMRLALKFSLDAR